MTIEPIGDIADVSLTNNTGPSVPSSEADAKLVHRWVLDDVGTGTATDSEGSADGTVNGVSSVSGNWAGGSAGDGSGTDHIDTTTLGSYGSNISSGFAIALSVQTTAKSGMFCGETSPASGAGGDKQFNFGMGNIDGLSSSDGEISVNVRGDGGNANRVSTDNRYDNGNEYRVVITSSDGSGSTMELWVNQSNVSQTTGLNQGVPSFSDFSNDFALFATNSNFWGTPAFEFDGIIDDVCLFDSDLTATEIQSYSNPW